MTCFRGQSEGPSCTCHSPNPSASSIQYAKVLYLGVACPEPRHQFVVRSKQDNEKQWTLFCFVTTLGESPSLCESWWGGRILAPWANWAFQYSGDSGKVTPGGCIMGPEFDNGKVLARGILWQDPHCVPTAQPALISAHFQSFQSSVL